MYRYCQNTVLHGIYFALEGCLIFGTRYNSFIDWQYKLLAENINPRVILVA